MNMLCNSQVVSLYLPVCTLSAFSLFRLFSRFILEAPGLSESVIDIIKRYCEDPVSFFVLFCFFFI